MVVSQPSGANSCELKSDSNSKIMSRTSEHQPSTVESARDDPQQCSPLPRSPANLSSCRSQYNISNSSVPQRSPSLLRIFSNASSESTPKDRVKLQPLSPVSLDSIRPKKFGGYRPYAGVILHNLTSGSEPSSDYENPTNRYDFPSKIDRSELIPTSRSVLTSKISRDNLNNPNDVPSRNDELRSDIGTPVSKISTGTELPLSVKSNDQNLTPLSSSRMIPWESTFYRHNSTPRSDYGVMKDSLDKCTNQLKFHSARENTDSYDKRLEPLPSFTRRIYRGTVSRTPKIEALEHTNYKFEKEHCDVESARRYQEISTSKELLDNSFYSNLSTNVDQAKLSEGFPSGKGSLQASKTIFRESMFRNSQESPHNQETVDSEMLKASASKCFLVRSGNRETKVPSSTRIIHVEAKKASSPQSKSCPSDRRSVASLKEFSSEKFDEKRNVFPRVSIGSNQELFVETKNQDFQEEYSNVPELALNSQEMSSSVSPISKTLSKKRLNANDLIEALSNASLKHVKDPRRVSGSSLSENIETENSLNTTLRSNENLEVCGTFSRKSQTPLNVSNSKIISSTQREQTNSSTVSIELGRQTYRKEFLMSDCEDLESNRPYQESYGGLSPVKHFRETVRETSDSSKGMNFKEQKVGSDSRLVKNSSQDHIESENSSSLEKDIRPTNSSSFLQNINSSDRVESMEETQNVTRHSSLSDESSINQSDGETFRSSNSSDDQNEQKKDDDGTDSPLSNREPTNDCAEASHCYEKCQSLSKHPEDSDSLMKKIQFNDSTTFPISCQMNLLESIYEGEVSDRFTESTKPGLLAEQVGDGQDMCLENSKKSCFESSDSSPEDGQERIRVSLERLVADQFRKNIYAEHAKAIQSDTSTFFSERCHDLPSFSGVQYASTSKLRHPDDSSRYWRKSQDRFPFTISEKPSTASYKHPGRLGNMDEESNSLERTYKLDLHPSITRLAGGGFEDTPAGIIDYVSYIEEQPTKSGMRGLMQRFSARLKKSKKREGDTGSNANMTSVLYENRDYHGDSVGDSCSESSLLKEFKMYQNLLEKPRINKESPDEKSSTITEKSPCSKSKSPKDTLPSVDSSRRSDHQDLWVQKIKNPNSSRKDEHQIVETPKKTEEKTLRDPYSVFFVKSSQTTPDTSGRELLPEEEPRKDVSSGRKRNKVRFRGSTLAVMAKVSDENVPKEQIKKQKLESSTRKKNANRGCLCLRFYRMIIPIPKNRSRISRATSSLSIKRKSRFSSRIRKG
ncbi:hypothetical protein WN55_03831 [Dufourea novaeangliae]|uniref:Uncharacterized protein n=1 Tax=Dufourea novaeangliae TaxID=178035 RepID=A0A154NWJ5_DUFNO|nr:hypothetical protein WN55_03831 [Dufourea novaeangliae]